MQMQISGPVSFRLADCALLVVFSGSLLACGTSASRVEDRETTGCATGEHGEPYELRCSGLYSDWPSKTIAPDVRPYAPGIALWSDGAVKTRWIWLPPGTTIDTSDMDEWVFPVGTKLWKQFVVAGKLIETRLLWKLSTGWYRTTYRWSSDGQDTTELVTGEISAEGLRYEVPSQTQCDECHAGQKDGVLGFSAISLSDPNATGLTLGALAKERLMTVTPARPIVVPGSMLDQGALGFLHINCGIVCHNKDYGAAFYTGFFMQLEVEHLESVRSTDTWLTGVNRAPEQFSAPGIVARIAPGNPSGSCAYYRMGQRDNVSAMPPIDTHIVDEAGLSLIGAWIDSLDAGAGAGGLDGTASTASHPYPLAP
jgi:hypothetical protein